MSSELRLHGDELLRDHPTGVLDFAVNVWPAAWPSNLRTALHEAVESAERYPDPRAATAAVATRHGRTYDEVVLCNGACEAFWLLAGAITPRHAVCVHPAFTEPEAALRAAGASVTRVYRPPADWRLLPEEIPDSADLVVVGNPNNPTGNLDSADTVGQLARPGRVLVVDESFIELTEQPGQSLAERRDLPGVVVVVRSLTKVWGLAGIRAGYLLAPQDLAARLHHYRQPWSLNSPALAALAVCAADTETPPVIAADVAAHRADLSGRLSGIPGVRVWPGAANFVLAKVERGAEVSDLMAADGIVVRRADTFPGLTEDYLRLAVRSPDEHGLLAAALQAALRRLRSRR